MSNGNHEWDAAHEAHLRGILRHTASAITRKYRAGQIEHQGQLWQKAGMLRHVEDEQTDLCVYLPTLRRQLEKVMAYCLLEDSNAAAMALQKILGEPEQ